MRPFAHRAFRFGLVFALVVGAIALFRTATVQSQDFFVMWRTAGYVLQGQQAYDVIRDGAMSFKYPPWVLPLFFPFALLSQHLAFIAWAILELGSIAAIVFWMVRQGCGLWLSLCVCLGFWGIWAVHLMDGQVSLPVLAMLLWVCRTDRGGVVALLGTSTKIFSGIACFAEPKWFGIKNLTGALILCLVLSLPVLRTYSSPGRMVGAWAESSSSAGVLFQGEKIRGRDNQGIPAWSLRVMHASSENRAADVWAFFGALVFFGGFWHRFSRRLDWNTRWWGWLALSAALHPLAWWHLFALAFPLCVWTLDQAVKQKKGRVLAIVGFILLAWVTRKTGGAVGEALELASVKSWGVLLLLSWQIKYASRV